MPATPTHRATGSTNVLTHEPKPNDDSATPAITEVHTTEEFTGGLVGTGSVRFQSVQLEDGGVQFTGMERFTGKLAERSGSFIFRNSGALGNAEVTAEWQIIPGSATGDLTGLRGAGGSTTADGYYLDYWFE